MIMMYLLKKYVIYQPLTHWNSGGLLAGFPQPGHVNRRNSASISTRLAPMSITQVAMINCWKISQLMSWQKSRALFGKPTTVSQWTICMYSTWIGQGVALVFRQNEASLRILAMQLTMTIAIYFFKSFFKQVCLVFALCFCPVALKGCLNRYQVLLTVTRQRMGLPVHLRWRASADSMPFLCVCSHCEIMAKAKHKTWLHCSAFCSFIVHGIR